VTDSRVGLRSRLTQGGLTRRTVAASVVLALLLGGVFGVLLMSTLQQRDARRLARHARAEITEAERLSKLVVDVESAERGYLLSGNESYLARWRAARAAFAKEAPAFAALPDDPVQARRAQQIARDGASYLNNFSVGVVRAVRRYAAMADRIRAAEEGERRVDVLRAEFNRFTAGERAALAVYQDRVDSTARRSVVVAAVGLGLSILLVAGFAGFLTRAVIRPVRRAAAMAGRLAGGDLAVRMPETGTAEVGDLQRAFNTMGSSLEISQDELRRLAEEQAALRRVATLVAHGVAPREVWDAVVAEVEQLLEPDSSALLRCGPDGKATIVATRGLLADNLDEDTTCSGDGDGGSDRESVVATVRRTGQPARLDAVGHDAGGAPGPAPTYRSQVGAPIVVEGSLWGVILAAWTRREPPPGTESHIAEFTELVATAIANAESRTALTASRARVVATADETRRRIERDLHDGAQQRLVHTIISLKLARRELGDGDAAARVQLLDEALEHAQRANTQLRELVQGILPAALRHGGLRAGVQGLAERAALPVSADVTVERLPPALEATAYFIVAEALTNIVKHADAGRAHVSAHVDGDILRIEVRDDGVGGASFGAGSGLLGLQDRAAALDGELRVESPPGAGTVVTAVLPIPSR
jgi:signal transduction histidine kinase